MIAAFRGAKPSFEISSELINDDSIISVPVGIIAIFGFA
jgi:hypothetical protein